MSAAPRWALAVWLVVVLGCGAVIARTEFTSDISAFLPRSPTPEQRILVNQLRDGVVSRLVLIGVEGEPPAVLARISTALAARLRTKNDFISVDNGVNIDGGRDREFLWRHRYLLSTAVTAEHFSVAGLRDALERSLSLLGSPAGMLLGRMLPSDPSGEMMHLIEQLEGQHRPAMQHGVWMARDGMRALLVAQTRAAGYDVDAQERALMAIRSAFTEAAQGTGAKLLLSGPGVFSVSARTTIKGDAWRFSVLATILIAAMLLVLYRSPRVLALGLLPVASGALAGVAAVSLGFGTVHGITLGFGVTLIGEGVDYAIYLFTQATSGTPPYRTLDQIWPTLRLGVLTSVCGFSAMLFSGFTGLAQLGLFSITGLVVAAAVTRWVLPALLPEGFYAPMVTRFSPLVVAAVRQAPRLRALLLVLVTLAAVLLAVPRAPMWSDELAALSPVPSADQRLDQQLRADLGAADVRHMVVVSASDQEAALQAAEAVAEGLAGAVRRGLLDGYETPTTFLPSRKTQRARQTVLPEPAQLRDNLREALLGLPYRAGVFEPFLKDVAAAREMALVDREHLDGTRLALKVDSLLVARDGGWTAMLPLRGVTDGAELARAIASVPNAQIVLLDLKRESDNLYQTYRREALNYSILGVVAIVILLFASLHSLRRVFDVLAPLVAAVVVTVAVLTYSNGQLTIFHLVGLLLVVAVGSNYSLFFDRQAPSDRDRERTLVSLLFASVSTMIGFGLLAFSSVPVLHAIGTTVGMGAILSLVFSAVLNRRSENAGDRT